MNKAPIHHNQEHTFIAQTKGRIDSIVSKELDFSRNRVKKLLDEETIYVNDILCQNASMKIMGGEHIKVFVPELTNHLQAQESNLEIVYKDMDIAVIVKPAGLTVHPCPSYEEQTLVHQLLHHFPQLQKLEGERPGIVHRLDKDTSGLMVIALHEEARLRLVEAFASRLVHKTYLALVAGQCENGESQESIGRHPSFKTKMAQVPLAKGGKEAYTTWERLFPPPIEEAVTKQGKNIPIPKSLQSSFSLMAVKIFTGRTHQIRVHLSEAGYPLLGDNTYAHNITIKNETNKNAEGKNKAHKIKQIGSDFSDKNAIEKSAPRQMLHAWKLTFLHPMTQETLSFTCPLPADFMETMIRLWHQDLAYQKIIITGNCGTGKSALLNAFVAKDVPTFSADACVQKLYEPHEDAWYLLKNQYGQRFIHENMQSQNKQNTLESIKSSKSPHGQNMPAVDKRALFDAMQEPRMRREIENIIHPLVFARLEQFFDQNIESELTSYENIHLKENEENLIQNTSSESTIRSQALATTTSKTLSDEIAKVMNKYNKKHFCHFVAAEIPLWFESHPAHMQEDCHIICVLCDDDVRLKRLKQRGWSEETIATMESWQWTQEDKAKNADYIIDNTQELDEPEKNLAMHAKQIMKDIAQKQRALLEKRLRILQKNMNAYN